MGSDPIQSLACPIRPKRPIAEHETLVKYMGMYYDEGSPD
jgi:hypothetical protein